MKIDVSVSIDAQQPVQQAVALCWASMFDRPKYAGEKGGAGWEAVRHQVARHVETLDLSAEIERAASAKLAALVDDAVTAALSAAIKKRVKALQESGQLPLAPKE